MPRPYTVEFEAQTIAAASGDYDLVTITPATNKPVEIVAITLDQSSELGDAQEEQLRLRLIRGHTTAPSGGAAATPRPNSPNDAAAAFTARVCDTAIAAAGTPINLFSRTFNVRAGFEWGPRPNGMGEWCSAAETMILLRLMAAVADDLTLSGTMDIIEYP